MPDSMQRLIENNALVGTLPTELGSLTSLEAVVLRNNDIDGAIPRELGQCKRLVFIDLDTNKLVGDIGPVIDLLPRNLESFDLDSNLLEGSIPTSVGTLGNLNFFAARGNNLNGTIPSEFGQLSKLELLDLSSNKLSGSIPTSLASLPLLGEKSTACLVHWDQLLSHISRPSTVSLSIYDNDLVGRLGAFCGNSYERFAANTCGHAEIDCACCNQCCSPDTVQCQNLSVVCSFSP